MENPTDINSANRGWMWRVGLLEVVWGRERPKILRCVKAELPILSILLLPSLLTKSHVLIWPECKSQSEGLCFDQRGCRRRGDLAPFATQDFSLGYLLLLFFMHMCVFISSKQFCNILLRQILKPHFDNKNFFLNTFVFSLVT